MTRNYPFHARSFVKRMIRMRKRLMAEGVSKGNPSQMCKNIATLEKLLPGEKSKSYKKVFSQFQEIYDEAMAIRHEWPKPALV